MSNPFRDLKKYPIDKSRVEKLKESIKHTKFWGGLVCRPHPAKKGYFQSAFGHHRIEALKDLKVKEISMKVFPYTDTQMLQAMANENRDIGQHDIKIMIQLIEQVANFMNEKLREFDTYKKFSQTYEFVSLSIFEKKPSQNTYTIAQSKGVGRPAILNFLGNTWNTYKIDFAIKVLKDEEDNRISRQAIETFPNRYQADEFERAILNAKVPIEEQMIVAKKTKKILQEMKEEGDDHGGREIGGIVRKITAKKETEDPNIIKAKKLITKIQKSSEKLLNAIADLDSLIQKLEITQMEGLDIIIANNTLKRLIDTLNEIRKNQKQIKGETK